MYMGPSQISFFVYYIGAPSDLVYRLLYGGPSDQFFHLLYGASLRLVSVLTIWGPLGSVFVHTTCIWGPPQVSFFAYYRGPPQISFFAYYMGPPSSQFFRLLYRSLLMPVSSLTMWGLPDQFLRILYGAHSDQFLSLLDGGPPQVSFFAYYMRALSDQLFCLLCGGPLRSDSSHTIWGPQVSLFAYYRRPPQISLFAYYMVPPQVDFFTYYMWLPP